MLPVSAETVGLHMPAVVSLDDLAAMNAADTKGHRYETSPEGMLFVMPPPDCCSLPSPRPTSGDV
jgi:hypothetical protein